MGHLSHVLNNGVCGLHCQANGTYICVKSGNRTHLGKKDAKAARKKILGIYETAFCRDAIKALHYKHRVKKVLKALHYKIGVITSWVLENCLYIK